MNSTKLTNTLTKCIKNGLPVLIKGAPGIGKSDIVATVAKELKMDLVVMHPVVSDPTDFKGLPGIVDGEAEFLPFGDLRNLMGVKRHTICFLDDLGQAPACVQAAAMQLILARQINGHKISDKIIFVAATNRREDKAGVTSILEPVKSRFATIIQLDADANSWIEWALANDVNTQMIGFIHFRPDMLCTGDATNDIVNRPCPRTITYASKLLDAGIDDMETLGGSIGEGAAAELCGFLKMYNDLPNIDEIAIKPEDVKVPTEPAALYAVTSALVKKTDKKNFANIMKYINRIPADFSMLYIRDLVTCKPEMQNTETFIKWVALHNDILL